MSDLPLYIILYFPLNRIPIMVYLFIFLLYFCFHTLGLNYFITKYWMESYKFSHLQTFATCSWTRVAQTRFPEPTNTCTQVTLKWMELFMEVEGNLCKLWKNCCAMYTYSTIFTILICAAQIFLPKGLLHVDSYSLFNISYSFSSGKW
jgi:hypothetical protein